MGRTPGGVRVLAERSGREGMRTEHTGKTGGEEGEIARIYSQGSRLTIFSWWHQPKNVRRVTQWNIFESAPYKVIHNALLNK